MTRPTSLVLLLLSIGLFYTFTSPQYQKMKAQKAVAGEYNNVIDNVEKIAETRDKLLLSYESIPKAQIDRIAKVLPNNIDTVRLAVDLDSIASRYGISIKNVQVENNVNDGVNLLVLPEYGVPYEKVTISFTFISNYDSFMKFLGDLERSLRIMDVKSTSFRATESGLYEYRLAVTTYWLK